MPKEAYFTSIYRERTCCFPSSVKNAFEGYDALAEKAVKETILN